MLGLAAIALAVSAAQPPMGTTVGRTGPVVQAQATVRILSGVRLQFGGAANADAPPARPSSFRTTGSPQPALLIQFE